MKKINTLVLTRRAAPPISIFKCLELATLLSPKYANIDCNKSAVDHILLEEEPGVVMIDGEYGVEDRQLWAKLNTMTRTALRLYLLDPESDLPQSLLLLGLIHALKEDGTAVVIFLDDANDMVKAELMKIGATAVWPTLNRLSNFESSFYQIASGAQMVGTGVSTLVKSFLEFFPKI